MKTRLLSIFAVTFLLGLFLVTPIAYGDGSDSRSKIGFDVKGFRTNLHPDLGWVGGLRLGRFLGKSDAYWGLTANFGDPTGKDPKIDNLFYGGILIGYDGKFGRLGVYEFSLTMGYGQGKFDEAVPPINETSYLVLEPSAGVGFNLGLGWRFQFTLSYLHMAKAPHFCGPMFGIRIDNRIYTSIRHSDP